MPKGKQLSANLPGKSANVKKVTAPSPIVRCNIAMTKNNHHLSPAAEQRAEKELDAFLRRINGPAIDIMAELRELS